MSNLNICTECGLEIPSNEGVLKGPTHEKRGYCREAGERIRELLGEFGRRVSWSMGILNRMNPTADCVCSLEKGLCAHHRDNVDWPKVVLEARQFFKRPGEIIAGMKKCEGCGLELTGEQPDDHCKEYALIRMDRIEDAGKEKLAEAKKLVRRLRWMIENPNVLSAPRKKELLLDTGDFLVKGGK